MIVCKNLCVHGCKIKEFVSCCPAPSEGAAKHAAKPGDAVNKNAPETGALLCESKYLKRKVVLPYHRY
jgi:hypothetical protein